MQSGIYCPSITPLTADGEFDFAAWEAHLDNLTQAGVNGILIFGSIGEFYSFSSEEKIEATKFAKSCLGDRTQLLVGTGTNSLDETTQLTRKARAAGADGAVVVSPYYFGPTEEQAEQYFTELARATDTPLILYNFPDRTGTDLSPSLVGRLSSANPNIVGLKDTVDSIAHNRQEIKATGDNFAVLSGFDEYYISNRIAGGAGVLSGLTNVVPETFVKMHRSYEDQDYGTALSYASAISRLMAVYEVGDWFIPTIQYATRVKTALNFKVGTRAHHIPLSDSEKQLIETLVFEI